MALLLASAFPPHEELVESSYVVVMGDKHVSVLLRNITDRMNTYVSKMGFIGLAYIMWAG